MESKNYKKCVICGKRRLPKSNVFLARFPLDPNRCRLWVKSIGIEDLAYLPLEKLNQLKFVCGAHFTRECFNERENRLKRSAVPTLEIPNPPLPDEVMKEFNLHVEYEKEQQTPKKDPLMECTNTIKLMENIWSAPSVCDKENILGHPATSTVEENAPYQGFIPIASSSTAPDHLTFKRNNEQTASEDQQKTVMVQSYKRSKISDHVQAVQGKTREMTQKEKLLLRKLQNAKITIKMLANTSINLDKIESDTLKAIVTNAVRNQQKKPQGKRWGMKNKINALAIFKRSPKAYRYMRKVMPLPSEKTLQRMLKNVPIEPGIHKNILQYMSKKCLQLKENDRFCSILFDEMALKKRLIYNEAADKVEGFVDLGPGEGMGRTNKVADHALVVMIQGLRVKYKQPIAHYFVEGTISSQKLASIIKDVIINIRDAGLIVVATVCDQGPTNVGALNLLKSFDGLSKDSNFFYVNGEKVYTIYDIPHLFKSIRNNFFNAGKIKYDGKIGQWSHLVQAEERNKGFLNFNKLSTAVVKPTYKIKMKVKYAAYALSNTMQAILKMMAWKNDDSEAIMETAFIIEQLDKLFDCTNGPASLKDIKKGIRENVSIKTNHVESWNHYLKIMETLKFINIKTNTDAKNVRCIKGFQISLNSLKDIWNFVQKKGFKYLNLRQLNQDSLENLFGNIRQHSVTNNNPTCSHFTAALKSCIISGLTGPHSRGSNCEADSNELFIKYKEINLNNKKQDLISEEIEILHLNDCSYPLLSLPEEPALELIENNLHSFEDQPVVYVSGYIAAKILNEHTCIDCKKYLSIEDPKENSELYNYISLREWWQDKKSLTYPSINLCQTVSNAKNYYQATLSQDIHKLNIGQECFLQLNVNCSFVWFTCQQHFIEVTEKITRMLSYLFIRKSCKIVNNKYKMADGELADKQKRGQQSSAVEF